MDFTLVYLVASFFVIQFRLHMGFFSDCVLYVQPETKPENKKIGFKKNTTFIIVDLNLESNKIMTCMTLQL